MLTYILAHKAGEIKRRRENAGRICDICTSREA